MNFFSPKRKPRGRSRSLSGNLANIAHTPSLAPLDCSIELSNNKLKLRNGEWELENIEQLGGSKKEIEQLKEKINSLEKQNVEQNVRMQQLKEDNNLLQFKNKVLIELLATAQLDAEKNNVEWQHEQLKTDALKWELANTNIEIYRMKKQQHLHVPKDVENGSPAVVAQ